MNQSHKIKSGQMNDSLIGIHCIVSNINVQQSQRAVAGVRITQSSCSVGPCLCKPAGGDSAAYSRTESGHNLKKKSP